ncbi:8064_t:CDS:1, partial [Funneliformis geosporum]
DFSQRNITKILDIPKSTVDKVIKKYNKVGLTTTASRSGKPKVLSKHDSRNLVKIAKEIKVIYLKRLLKILILQWLWLFQYPLE